MMVLNFNKMNKIKSLLRIKQTALFSLLMLIGFIMSSCDLDVNVDPNNPATTTNGLLLSSAQGSLALAMGNSGNGIGQTASLLSHQIMFRGNPNFYTITGEDGNVNNPWIFFYRSTLPDLNQIIKQGTEQEQFQYVGIARILRAFMFNQMVDVWGDIPYFEAGRGTEQPFPKFDKAADIYADLFAELDGAITDLAKPAPTGVLAPGADDLIYGGSVQNWQRLAKVLKLKMYNTIRATGDFSSEINTLVNDADVTGFTTDFEFRFVNRNAPENRNPAFSSVNNGRGIYFTIYFYEILNNKSTLNTILSGISDPRFFYYCYNSLGSTNVNPTNPVEYRDGNFLSINFSSNNPNADFAQGGALSAPGAYFCGSPFDNQGLGGAMSLARGTGAAPQQFLTRHTISYIRAELALAGVTTEDARSLFQQAIEQSFAKVNTVMTTAAPNAPAIATSARDTYRDAVLAKYDAATASGKLEHILTQKWIANFGNALESYNDVRRTGFPRIFDPATDNNPTTAANNPFPFSFPYRQSDLILNPNAPKQKLVGTEDAKVFWDVD
jgi:hypothetical protein